MKQGYAVVRVYGEGSVTPRSASIDGGVCTAMGKKIFTSRTAAHRLADRESDRTGGEFRAYFAVENDDGRVIWF